MADKLEYATEGSELAWSTCATESINRLTKTCQNLFLTCKALSERIDILKDRIEKLELPRP